ncbi:hypothetical protein G9A89_001698, partial [Geosiphon pyriformis]
AGLSLASCARCKQFGYVSVNCSFGVYSGVRRRRVISEQDQVRLAGIYKKKSAPVTCLVSFGGKTWAQVAGSSLSRVVSSGASGVSLVFGSMAFSMDSFSSGAADLGGRLAVLECSVEILSDQVSLILKKLSFVDLVPLASSSSALPLVSPTAVVSDMDPGLELDDTLLSSASSSPNVGGSVVDFSLSSSKIGSSAFWIGFIGFSSISMSGLVWKFATCNVWGINVPAKQADIKDKFDGVRVFSSGLDKSFMGAGVAIVMNTSLARYVFKVEEIPDRIISVRLLFKGKLSVTVLGLYAGASSGARFGQASEVNTLIAKAVNSSNFVVLGGDLNENRSGRSASFKFCLSLGLVNSFVGHHLANSYTWSNSRGVGKMIDYIFVGGNLSSAVAGHQVVSVSDFFDTDHKAVVVSVGLGGLLDVQLNSLRKQTNKDCWKFKIRNADCVGWANNAAANKQKAITAMYTEATVEGKPIRLILDSGSTGSIITYQLMQQLQKTVDRPAQTVIIIADSMKKTSVEEIDNFSFTIDGIIISVKVLVMNALQYQALVKNNWLLKANANLDWKTQELKILYQGQHTIIPAICGIFNKQSEKAPVFEF